MEQLKESELQKLHEECLKYKKIDLPLGTIYEWEQFMERHGGLKIDRDGAISATDAGNYAIVDDMYQQLRAYRRRKKLSRPITPVDWAQVEMKKRDILQGNLAKLRSQASEEGIDISKIPF